MNALSIVAGGGVRIGLEDNIWYDTDRTRLATNRDLVEKIILISRTLGCRPFTPKEARAILGL